MSQSELKKRWDNWSRRPGGKWLFSKAVGLMAPYTGTIRPQVQEIRDGYARVRMRERRRLRQHLRSVHAAALFNLSECTSALAMMYGLPADTRAIPTALEIKYVKKGRGLLIAEATAPVPESSAEGSYDVEVAVRDAAGDLVVRVTAHWLVRPKKHRRGT